MARLPEKMEQEQTEGRVQQFWDGKSTSAWWLGAKLAGFCALLMTAGCAGFFVKPDNSGGGTGSTANRVYVMNTTAQSIAAFTVSSSGLAAIPGSPFGLGYTPQAAVVTRSNNLLYVAGPGTINVYTITSTGALSASSSGAAVATANVLALDVSPDGNWLVGLDATSTVLNVWKINPSTGALSTGNGATYSVTDAVVQPRAVRVSPGGTLIFAALGTGGDHVFTFNTSTGTALSSQHLSLGSTTVSDNGLAVNSTGSVLFIARSGSSSGVAVYIVGAGGALNQITNSPFAAGGGPVEVALSSDGKYAYAANRADGSISGFSVGSGSALTAVPGSPFASGTLLNSLGFDRTGAYLLAASTGGSPDLGMYGFSSTMPGALTQITTIATGTSPTGATLVAATH